ncbi:MAG: DUF3696 domain-containing protein [Acidobacteriota bacterium]|nr:DUF3696 domain-containing protein [Acidobacteriota bacterium]
MSRLDVLRIGNFKAFGRTQRVPLRPITLLFGANSSGKSSVIHSLALAQHAAETGDVDVHRTSVGGDSIDLGGYRSYVHRRYWWNHQVELAFEWSDGTAARRLGLPEASRVGIELSISADGADSVAGALVSRYALLVDGAPLLTMSARSGGVLVLDLLDADHSAFKGVFSQRPPLVPASIARTGQLLPAAEAVVGAGAEPGRKLFPRFRRASGHQRPAGALESGRENRLRQLLDGAAAPVEEALGSFRYLGPLRSYPPRQLNSSSGAVDPNWLAGGGHAWDVVRTNDGVRGRVNEWLGDTGRLKTPYELQVQELLPAGDLEFELGLRLGETLDQAALKLLEEVERSESQAARSELASTPFSDQGESLARVLELIRQGTDKRSAADNEVLDGEIANVVGDIIESDTVAEGWIRDAVAGRRGEARSELSLIDKRSVTPVSHRDVGIGVSQLLPVLVAAFASSDKWIAIEQPEIHLHPALQAELGDVFLESALGEAGNRFLIETHSEHLMLRILRRIRETSDGEEVGFPVKPEDVAVLYVEPGSEGAEVVHIPITPDGDFAHPWPDGFFDEREEELF